VIHAGTQKGQSVHHIMSSNKDLFAVCEKTVYRYINAGLIRTKRGDMPRSCVMKPRKRKNPERKVDSGCRINRTHDDFKKRCEQYPDSPVVEMDSVLGGIGGKVLLTIHFNNCGLMLAFLRSANNSQSVIDVFNLMEK
jgi:IS30 family transposase